MIRFGRNKALLFVLAFLVWLDAGITLAQEAKIKDLYVEVILDASNSMNELLEGRKKIDIAKDVLNEVLGDISPDTHLALRIYGSDQAKFFRPQGRARRMRSNSLVWTAFLKLDLARGIPLRLRVRSMRQRPWDIRPLRIP